MTKRKVEVFTAGCPICEPVVAMVKDLACDSCDLTVYNLSEQGNTSVYLEKVKEYNITSLPAVAINGELLSCCSGRGVSREQLLSAGIGQQQ